MKVMRCAFVVRLGRTTKPDEGKFEGVVEEVDTGKERWFCSREELFKFFGECFTTATVTDAEENTLPDCSGNPDAN
jgi:hypothetical protein